MVEPKSGELSASCALMKDDEDADDEDLVNCGFQYLCQERRSLVLLTRSTAWALALVDSTMTWIRATKEQDPSLPWSIPLYFITSMIALGKSRINC